VSYSNVRDSGLLGPVLGVRVVEITQHDEDEFKANGESRIYFHFENGITVSFPIGDDGFDINDPTGDDDEDQGSDGS
jgi:hypothetical protein